MKDGLGVRMYDVQKCGLYESRTSDSHRHSVLDWCHFIAVDLI
jgi:hypothetical protein